MTMRRVGLAAALLVTALTLQVTVVNPLRLPGGGPDLVLLVVIGLALVQGPLAGAVTGFVAGLLVDIVPPVSGAAGHWALVLCLVGYLAGLVRADARRPALVVLALVAALSALSILASAGLSALFGDPRVDAAALQAVFPAGVLYDLGVAAFVVPGVMALARRAEPEPVRL